jgi:transcriptional regulator with XRE-family HTH domain
MQSLQNQVGARLKAIREQKGLSQEALAGLCNLHRTYIGLIERGQRSLSIPTIELIAQALEVSPAKLFEGPATLPAARPGKTRQRPAKDHDIAANIAAIRQILIDARLVDAGQYTKILKSHERTK